MRILVSIAILSAALGTATAREMARQTRGGMPSTPAAVSAAPNTPDAPAAGVITRVDPAAGTLSITGRDLLIAQPYVALVDKRPNANGLLKVADLRVGMRVRYRAQDGAGALPRVVELWVLRDAETVPSPNRPR